MVKSVKAVDLKSTFCGFESRLGHHASMMEVVYIRVLETRSYKFKSCYSHQCGYKLVANYYLAKVISSVRPRLSAPFAAIRQCLDFHSSKVTIWVGVPVAAPCSVNSEVECQFYTLDVVGSNPAPSTIFPDRLIGKSSVFGTEVLRSNRGWGAIMGM